jgi:hypothetical protein
MKKAAFLSALLVSGVAALAQAPAEAPATTKTGPNQDPNQIVCQTQTEIGSRLNRRRVCRTRAEWAAHQRMYRDNIEKAQQQSMTDSRDPGM